MRGAIIIRVGIPFGSRLKVLVLIMTGGTFRVSLPSVLLPELAPLRSVQRPNNVATALCRTLALVVLLLFAGMLELIIYDRMWFPLTIVLGNEESITLRVCRGLRQCITLAPVCVVVAVDNMVVLGQWVELAINLIILCEHPLLESRGR